jgi:hypothetical protein
MDRLQSFSVRFHYRGEMQHDGKEWKYQGGKSGLSEIRTSKLFFVRIEEASC